MTAWRKRDPILHGQLSRRRSQPVMCPGARMMWSHLRVKWTDASLTSPHAHVVWTSTSMPWPRFHVMCTDARLMCARLVYARVHVALRTANVAA
eukprot:15405634-Alexandrium_andersonii.AAC.1